MKYLLTYEDALILVNHYNNVNFSKSETIIDGFKVVTFTYFLCGYNHFENPIEGSNIKAYDMRGTTFVFNLDGSLFRRYFMLPKFFNLNQVESTQYDLVKDKKIRNITNKDDGSLIAFMQLPNGKIFAKTIGGFSNMQSEVAMKLVNEKPLLKKFIIDIIDFGYTPLFEYVSKFNRIVLKYGNDELKLIGVRNNNNGDHINSSELSVDKKIVKCVDSIQNKTLNDLIEEAKTKEDIEGWVVEFEDGQMIKLKVDWYFRMHSLRTENVFREDYVIKNYLEEKLDDIVCQLDPIGDSDAFKFIERVKLAVNNKLVFIDNCVNELVTKYNDMYNKDWISFATNEHNYSFFGLAKILIEKPELYRERKNVYIIIKTKHLNLSKTFVDKWSGYDDKDIEKFKNRKDDN